MAVIRVLIAVELIPELFKKSPDGLSYRVLDGIPEDSTFIEIDTMYTVLDGQAPSLIAVMFNSPSTKKTDYNKIVTIGTVYTNPKEEV